MTCREKLAQEHPEDIGEYIGGCRGCPHVYGYLPRPEHCPVISNVVDCSRCWDREIPGTEKESDIRWDKIKELIDNAMKNRDKSVSIYMTPDGNIHIMLQPWPDVDELYDQYRKGRITANDYRAKMGLPMVKNAEQFMRRD